MMICGLPDLMTRELRLAGWYIAQEENGIETILLPNGCDMRIKYWECKLKEQHHFAWTTAPLRFRACCRLNDGYGNEEEYLQIYIYKQILAHFLLANHLQFRRPFF
jgi:hypothetical protein